MLDFFKGDTCHRVDYEIQFTAVDTTKHRMIYENNSMEVWTIPLRHRVPTTGYLFREKEGLFNIRREAIEKYDLGIAQIVAAKNGEDVIMADGTVIPNQELTYVSNHPRSYAYCSDTIYSGKVVSLAQGVDLMYHEATFMESEKRMAKDTGHSTAAQAAKAALNAGVDKLIMGHFSSRYKDLKPLEDEARQIFPESYIAEEGKTFSIPFKSFSLPMKKNA